MDESDREHRLYKLCGFLRMGMILGKMYNGVIFKYADEMFTIKEVRKYIPGYGTALFRRLHNVSWIYD